MNPKKEIIRLRKPLKQFAVLMEKILRSHDQLKGSIADCLSEMLDGTDAQEWILYSKLTEEFAELVCQLDKINKRPRTSKDRKRIAKEAANLANICMMIAVNYGDTEYES